MSMPSSVKLVEVSPRDGLQNERQIIPTDVKIKLINNLASCGLTCIEVGSFVSPKWVPQMADTADVLSGLDQTGDIHYPVLVPNLKGLEQAIASGVKEIAVFGAASETFSQKNINCSIAESLERFSDVVEKAIQQRIRVRGYVSCVLGCPYEGDVDSTAVARVAKALYEMGCYEISLGDTVGVGTALQATKLIEMVTHDVPVQSLAVHFHDTYGQALANIFAVLPLGIAVVDCSVAGLGGCPYAPGAGGNVATEDVVYLLNGLGIETGVDLQALVDVGWTISNYFDRPSRSKVGLAMSN